MRSDRFLLFIALLSFSVTAAAQQVLQKDPQAVAVLVRLAAATGWSSLSIPRDVIGTGIVTRHIGDLQDTINITVKVKGPRRYRTEVTESSGVTTTIVDGERAAVLAVAGTRVISASAALTMRPVVFPFLSDLVALSDVQVSFRYAGTESLQGEVTHRIEVDREPAPGDKVAELRRRAGHLTVWVSESSGLVVQIEYVRIAQDNSFAVQRRVRSFSDYRVTNGMAIPFHQVESVEGQILYTLQLTGVRFNTGLSDTEFTLPGGQD